MKVEPRRLGLLGATLAALPFSLCLAGINPAFFETTNAAGINVIFSASGYTNDHYTGGGATADFNGDGWQDLYIPTGGAAGIPDRLYINNQDGTFTDRAMDWGLTTAHLAKGFAVGDYNDDGWLDLYVTSAGPTGSAGPCFHKLYRNDAGSGFTDVASQANVDCTTTSEEDGFGATFGDIDLDGDLDLFVAGFASNNTGSRMFENHGNGLFTDITDLIDLFDDTPIAMNAFTPRLIDMDGDFYPELLLVADFGTSRYFKNNTDGTFTDVTVAAGTSLEENGMGGTVGDFNGDLLLDWYVTSVYLPRLDFTGNKLYLNDGDHEYTEVAGSAGVHDGGYGWGALAVDFNHDTLLDIAETNGAAGSGGDFADEPSYLWMNLGDDTFVELGVASGLVHTDNGRGMLNLDYDNDGDQDIAIFGNLEFARLYENTLDQPNTNWFRVFLDTSAVPDLAPDGHGSRVKVTSGLLSQLRVMTSGDNFLSHSELSAHFGLKAAGQIDLLAVEWPNGQVTRLTEIGVNQTVTLMADGPPLCSPAPGEVDNLRLSIVSDGSRLQFTWDDAPDADSYRVQADSQSTGGFELVVGDATSGTIGVDADMPPGMKFFLVAGRKDGCQGMK